MDVDKILIGVGRYLARQLADGRQVSIPRRGRPMTSAVRQELASVLRYQADNCEPGDPERARRLRGLADFLE